MLGALRNETEAGLVCVELKNAAESLLGNHGEIIGIVEEDPCGGAGDGANTADKFCEALADGSDAAVIGARQAECHRGLVLGAGNTLCSELLGNPGVG